MANGDRHGDREAKKKPKIAETDGTAPISTLAFRRIAGRWPWSFKLRLVFPVPESIVAMIKVGMPVDVGIQATGHTVHGSVSRMSDKVDPATRTMHVEVDLDNADLHWKAGMYATATITLNAKSDALAAPVQAVVTGDKPNVWVVNARNVVEERPVTLGIQTPDQIEITNGVSEADLLVYGDRSDVSPGMKVTPKYIRNDRRISK